MTIGDESAGIADILDAQVYVMTNLASFRQTDKQEARIKR